VADVAGIAREALAIPLRIWLGIAEVGGELVLALWRGAAVPVALLVAAALRRALAIGEREVTPARGLTAVAVAATVALGASQFSDYRAVEVGTAQYRGVEDVAPAPQVDAKTPRSAHGIAVFTMAVASLFVIAFAVGGRWRLARLLLFIGAAAIAVSLIVDVPDGLREGRAGLAYEGAEAVLLGGFWAQLSSGAVLALMGPLLAGQLRGQERAARRARRRLAVSPNGPLPGSGVEGVRT
jgi:hypothetical protein